MLKKILNQTKIKYNENQINYFHIIQSISYFEDAEDENLPKVFIEYNWDKIKEYYEQEQKRILKNNNI